MAQHNILGYNPRRDALLSVGQALLKSGQWSTMPKGNILEGIGPALLGAQQRGMAYQMADLKRRQLEQNLATGQAEERRRAARESARARLPGVPSTIRMLSREAAESPIPGQPAPEGGWPYPSEGVIQSNIARAQRGILNAADPDIALTALGRQVFQPPPMGNVYAPGETQAHYGRLDAPDVFTTPPLAPVPQYGDVLFDKQTGKFYQLNPETNKREYINPPSGLEIVQTPDGGFTFRQGPGVGGGDPGSMTQTTRGGLEQDLLNRDRQLARLEKIEADFEPKYQTWRYRGAQWWTGLKSKLDLGPISEEDQAELTEFKSYQRDSIENINAYIKEVTGAQMSEKEADRIRLAQPDPGEGVFGGDDPITFKAKLTSGIRSAKLARARYAYALKNGLSLDVEILAEEIPLEVMSSIIGARMQELESQGLSDAQIGPVILGEFGISLLAEPPPQSNIQPDEFGGIPAQ